MGVLILRALFLYLFLISQQTKADEENYKNASSSSTSVVRKLASGCNFFQGKWVYDSAYPLYDSSSCPFIDPEFNCQKYGRPDKLYKKYRWQPFSCDLPRFNGLEFLERWRGKKIMFVGDSLSLNMWESLNCMIHARVPNANISFIKKGFLGSVTFQDYGVKILLYRTPFLVDLEDGSAGRVLKLDSIRNGNAWRGMDVLIFNSWHWWIHTGKDQPWDYMQEGNKLYKDMNRLIAYYKGMTTWARWVNLFVDPSKTKVFFQGISPTHYIKNLMKEKDKKESQEMTTHFESIAEKVRASAVPSVEGDKEKNEDRERNGRRSKEGKEKLEDGSKEAEEDDQKGSQKEPREKQMEGEDGSGGEGKTVMSLEEISKYRQAAQQASVETIRAAEERYVKAAKESAAYVAEKGARAKESLVEGAQKASELVAEKGRAVKDTALEKGQQGYVAAKDKLAGAAGKKPAVEEEESEARKSDQIKGEAGGQGIGEGADSRARASENPSERGAEEISEGAPPMELHGGRDQWGEGGLLQAIGETIVEIAQNTKDLIIGRDPK